MPDYSHSIIAGVNKCATTSLYRYLADHPEVCGSKVKETLFFFEYVTPDSELLYENYLQHFEPGKASIRVLLEASPGYFTSGARIANRIASLLPEAKLIVMLRNPVERLHSYYRSAKVYGNYAAEYLAGYSFDAFVREAIDLAHGSGSRDNREAEFVRAIRQGNYASHAQKFHSVFPDAQIMYVFFEDFCRAPRHWMVEVSRYLGISEEFYQGYNFSVENRTRNYRMQALHRLAFRVNMTFERLLNRYPNLRKELRSLYLRFNEDGAKSDATVDPETKQLLVDFYREDKRRMQEFLSERYPSVAMPGWLTQTEATD